MLPTRHTVRRRAPWIAITISLGIHLSVLAAFVGIPYLLIKKDFPGPGESVQVWLTEPTGSVGVGPRHGVLETFKRKPGKDDKKIRTSGATTTDTMVLTKKRADEREGTADDSELHPEKGGTGGLGGPGVGRGSGGDKRLAEIWNRINASKYYPATARRSGITGSPKVTFSISKNGDVENVRLAVSCGKKILDNAAIETVKRAAPLPYYPKPITVAVKYSLNR